MSEELALLKRIASAVERMAGPDIATDREMDGKFGNGPVKFMPRDWTGQDYKGAPFSDCPPELLTMLADSYAYFAVKNEGELTQSGKPKSDFDLLSARLCRGWAKRNRQNPPKPKDDVVDSEWAGDSNPF